VGARELGETEDKVGAFVGDSVGTPGNVGSSGLEVGARELGETEDKVGVFVGRVNVRSTVGSKVGSIIGTDVGSTVGVNVGSVVGAVDESTVGVNDKGSFVGFNVGCLDGIRLKGVLEGDIEGNNLVGFRVFMLGILVGSAVGSLVGTKEGIKEEGDDVEGLRVGRIMGALEVGVLDGFIDTGRFDDDV